MKRVCEACRRGQGPWSLHHWDDGGCNGTFGGATFTLEGDGPPWTIVRVEPAVAEEPAASAEEPAA